MRIGIGGSVMVAICRKPFPPNIRRQPLIRLLPPLNTGLKSANKRTLASHQLHPHSATTSTKRLAQPFLLLKKKAQKMSKLTSKAALPAAIFSHLKTGQAAF